MQVKLISITQPLIKTKDDSRFLKPIDAMPVASWPEQLASVHTLCSESSDQHSGEDENPHQPHKWNDTV